MHAAIIARDHKWQGSGDSRQRRTDRTAKSSADTCRTSAHPQSMARAYPAPLPHRIIGAVLLSLVQSQKKGRKWPLTCSARDRASGTSFQTLMQTPDRQECARHAHYAAIASMKPPLEPQGRLCISDPNRGHPVCAGRTAFFGGSMC